MLYSVFSTDTWSTVLDIRHWYLTCYTWHMIHDTWYLAPILNMLYLTPDPRHLISDTGIWHVILDTWSTTLDTWHRYLTCYTWHLIHDTWYLIPVLDMLYLTPDIWHLTIDMLSLTWHVFTWYKHIWPDIVTPDWILLHLTPVLHYIFMIITFTGLGVIIILLPDIWYSWTPLLLNSCILEPLKQGDSWHYAPNIILLLIP